MKKTLALLLALLMVVTTISALAEEAETKEPTESQFERVLLKKGSLIVKEFIAYKSLSTIEKNSKYDVNFQTATLTDVETGTKYYALRMEHSYNNSQYDSGTSIGVLGRVSKFDPAA